MGIEVVENPVEIIYVCVREMFVGWAEQGPVVDEEAKKHSHDSLVGKLCPWSVGVGSW